MTPALMSPEVREEIGCLSRKAKGEIRAWLNNQMQIALTMNGNEAEDAKLPPAVRAHARTRERYIAEFQKQVERVFDLSPNRTLGATSDDDQGFVEKRCAL